MEGAPVTGRAFSVAGAVDVAVERCRGTESRPAVSLGATADVIVDAKDASAGR